MSKTPFQRVVDDLSGGCGCACHTGIGYRTSCEHCVGNVRLPDTGDLLGQVERLEARVAAAEAERDAQKDSARRASECEKRAENMAERALCEREALLAFVEAEIGHDEVWENHPTRPIRTRVHSPECRLCAVLAAPVPPGPDERGET